MSRTRKITSLVMDKTFNLHCYGETWYTTALTFPSAKFFTIPTAERPGLVNATHLKTIYSPPTIDIIRVYGAFENEYHGIFTKCRLLHI